MRKWIEQHKKIQLNISSLFNRKGTNDPAQVRSVMDFFNSIKTESVGDEHKDFYINIKVLSDVMEKLSSQDTETRTKIGMRMLGYLYKYAAPRAVASPAYPVNPMQTPQDVYYRDPQPNPATIRKGFVDYIADALQMDTSKLSPVNVARAKEFLKLGCISPSNPDFASWKDVGCLDETGEGTSLKFEEKFPNVSEIMGLLEKHGEENIYLDIDKAVQLNWKHVKDPNDIAFLFSILECFVHDVFQQGLFESLSEKYANLENPAERDKKIEEELGREMDKVRARIVVSTVFKLGNQNFTYLGNQSFIYNSRITDPGQEIPEENRSEAGRFYLRYLRLKKLSLESKSVSSRVWGVSKMDWEPTPLNLAGFFPTPQAVMENWLFASKDVSSILKKMGVDSLGQAITFLQADGMLIAFKDFSHFLNHDIVKSFAALSNETAPYLSILPKMIVKLLHSFDRGVADKAYAEVGLQDLLQFSMNRILYLMQSALDKKKNFPVFLHDVERMQEEIANIRMMTPLTTKQDLQQILKNTSLSKKISSAGMESTFFFENSGMSCAEVILHAWETSLSDDQDGGDIRQLPVIAISKYAYFEIQEMLELGKKYSVITFDDYSPSCVEDMEKALNEKFSGKKIGLIFSQFHPSFNHSNQPAVHKPTDATGILEKMDARGMLSEKLTNALDSTIGFIEDLDIEKFVGRHGKRAQEGKLNIVNWRTCVKFDFGGWGNLAGGLIGVHNNGAAFRDFDKAMKHHDETAACSRFDLHGVLHFQKHVPEELDQFRKAVMNAANRLMDPQDDIGFPASMSDNAEEPSPLSVCRSKDLGLPFVKVLLRIESKDIEQGKEYGQLLERHLVRHAANHPDTFPMMHRDSFAYNQTTFSSPRGTMRISPGLEPDDLLKNYRNYFVVLNDVLKEAKKKFPGRNDAVVRAVLEHGNSLVVLAGQRRKERIGNNIEEEINEAWKGIESKLPRLETAA